MTPRSLNRRPRQACRRLLSTGLLIGLLAATSTPTGGAAPAPGGVREHDIKAAFLFRFLQLVEWPDASFATTNSPLVIGLVKPDPFGNVLDRALRNKRIGNRAIAIRRGDSPADLLPCHLMFVPRQAAATIPDFTLAGRQGVLTVGETPGFLNDGGMINFYMLGNQLRFEINAEAAYDSGIRIRSRLLRLGRPEGGDHPETAAKGMPSP